MSCPPSSDPHGPYDTELYSLVDETRQVVTPSPKLPQCQSPPRPPDGQEISCSPDAVGAHWIRWVAGCYHCTSAFTGSFFQNIQTGEVRGDPSNETTYADLNSPTLAHTTCSRVRRLPVSYLGFPAGWGSLSSFGQFALAVGNAGAGTGAFLERCGTRMRRLLASVTTEFSEPDLVSNASTIVWQTAPNRLNGLFLPSLQTFTIPLPAAIAGLRGNGQGLAALTSGALYMRESGGTLWRTASPTALPLNVMRPSLTRSGSTLTCTRGSWHDASRFSYAWQVNGTAQKDAKPRLLTIGKAGKPRRVSCSVTASNAMGTTTASSAQLHVRWMAANR